MPLCINGVDKFEYPKDRVRKALLNASALKDYLQSINLNERQVKAVVFRYEKGKITNSEYQILNNISKETATGEFKEMINKKL